MGLGITELVGTGENVPVGYVDGSKGGINGVNGGGGGGRGQAGRLM